MIEYFLVIKRNKLLIYAKQDKSYATNHIIITCFHLYDIFTKANL